MLRANEVTGVAICVLMLHFCHSELMLHITDEVKMKSWKKNMRMFITIVDFRLVEL